MNRIYLILLCFLSTEGVVLSQVDTIIYEDFQRDVIATMPTILDHHTNEWTNYDQDKLNSIFNTTKTMRWWQDEFFTNAVDSVHNYTEYAAISTSFMRDALPGNRNWLILPPIYIENSSYILNWESAPRQLPRYMDGYQVLISNTGMDVENDFIDTLFTASSMAAITGDSQSTDFGNFSFTPGYMHAREGTDDRYMVRGSTVNFGLLEPHSMSLAAYEGQTIRIAFLHNSDDDDRLALDDILVTRESLTSVENEVLEEVYLYPIPAYNTVNVVCPNALGSIHYAIFNYAGQLVKQLDDQYIQGSHSISIDLTDLDSGQYLIKLTSEGEVITRSFSKF